MRNPTQLELLTSDLRKAQESKKWYEEQVKATTVYWKARRLLNRARYEQERIDHIKDELATLLIRRIV